MKAVWSSFLQEFDVSFAGIRSVRATIEEFSSIHVTPHPKHVLKCRAIRSTTLCSPHTSNAICQNARLNPLKLLNE